MHWWEVVGGLADEDRCREVCAPVDFSMRMLPAPPSASAARARSAVRLRHHVLPPLSTVCSVVPLPVLPGKNHRALLGTAVLQRRRANGNPYSVLFLPTTRTATRLISISLTSVPPVSVSDPDAARVARRRLLLSVTMRCGNRRDCAEGRTSLFSPPAPDKNKGGQEGVRRT